MSDGHHHTEIHRRRGDYGRSEFWVTCDCGYVSRSMSRSRDAEDDADEHVRLT